MGPGRQFDGERVQEGDQSCVCSHCSVPILCRREGVLKKKIGEEEDRLLNWWLERVYQSCDRRG